MYNCIVCFVPFMYFKFLINTEIIERLYMYDTLYRPVKIYNNTKYRYIIKSYKREISITDLFSNHGTLTLYAVQNVA
jgi:hypothetical protein